MSHLILDNFVRYISIDLAILIPMRPYFSSISLNMLIPAYNLTKNRITRSFFFLKIDYHYTLNEEMMVNMLTYIFLNIGELDVDFRKFIDAC